VRWFHVHCLQHFDRDVVILFDEPQQQMLRANVVVIQVARLFYRLTEHLLRLLRKAIDLLCHH
jgi:hypothetical protein